MVKNICAHNAYEPDDKLHINIDLPNKCPHCKVANIPFFVDSYFVPNRFANNLFISTGFVCPGCEKFYYASYIAQDRVERPNLHYISIIPLSSADKEDFSQNINEISPMFCSIYNEAYAAEQQGLNEICGMGYRKALEFLVKDFAIRNNPSDDEAIKAKALGRCIEEYIDNQRIKSLAKASAWLGNDETHYERRLQGYDLENLKAFIKALVSIIETECSILSAEQLISSDQS